MRIFVLGYDLVQDLKIIGGNVITAEDADTLLKEENLDIRNLKNAKAFLKAYNLNRFIIANDIEESILLNQFVHNIYTFNQICIAINLGDISFGSMLQKKVLDDQR